MTVEQAEQMAPAETIRTALHCANGECAIDEPDYQRALAWLDDTEANLATKGGADKATLARKLRRKNAALREVQEQRTAMAIALAAFCGSVHLSGRTIIQHDPEAYERLVFVLAAMPAELLAQRQREQSALEWARLLHASTVSEDDDSDTYWGLVTDLGIALAAVDGLKEGTP